MRPQKRIILYYEHFQLFDMFYNQYLKIIAKLFCAKIQAAGFVK